MNTKKKFGTLNTVSSEAVKKATGKTWDEWIKIIDAFGGKTMTHRDIARVLFEKKYIKSSWWCQMVTVGYEYAYNRRIVGQTADVGFQIGVQKTLPISSSRAWKLITSPVGRDIWLGKVKEWKLEKGFPFITTDHTTGEIRSIKQGERLRLTWKVANWKKPSTLQIYILPLDGKTSIRFHQEHLQSSTMRATMRKHWQEVLETFTKYLSRSTV